MSGGPRPAALDGTPFPCTPGGRGRGMSNKATGRLVLTDDPDHLIGLDGYTIIARHISAIIPTELTRTKTDADGRFTLRYEKDFEPVLQTFGPRTIEFHIFDRV